MVNAGHGIEGDEGYAVDNATHHRPGVAVNDGNYKAGNQRNYPEAAADDVGNHIENFFTFGVVGKKSVPKFGSFHKNLSLPYSFYARAGEKAT